MKLINNILNMFGVQVIPNTNPNLSYNDIDDPVFWNLVDKVINCTMVSIPNLYSLYKSVRYVVENNLSGDFVECGVWRGGCSMMMALTLKELNDTSRKIYLYDTFEGMTAPTANDKDIFSKSAVDLLKSKKTTDRNSVWCYSELDEVKKNMMGTGYPTSNMIFIKGKVEETLLHHLPPNNLSILRLDTDWYESTKIELELLFPKLVKNGILIIDDYGHWKGARKAVDEYFKEKKITSFLHRVDYTCRLMCKN